MSSEFRQPLTERQLEGLLARFDANEEDFREFRRDIPVKGPPFSVVEVWVWLGQDGVHISSDSAIGLKPEQVHELRTALREAIDFDTFGPGEWIDEGSGRKWRSALDADGNDLRPKASGEINNL